MSRREEHAKGDKRILREREETEIANASLSQVIATGRFDTHRAPSMVQQALDAEAKKERRKAEFERAKNGM